MNHKMNVGEKLSISIAMTTYNGSEYVVEQLESLLKQTRPADEVIILDDCSSDNTVEKVTQYIECHSLSESWKIHVNPNNLGYVGNFLACAQKCKGDIICFCDQDDIWDHTKLERIEDVFNKYTPTAVVSNYRLINSEGKTHSTLYSFYKNAPRAKRIDHISVVQYLRLLSSSGKALGFRRDILDELVLAVHSYQLTYDTPIGAIALFRDGFLRINRPLVHFRIHTSNTSAPSTKLAGRTSNVHRLITSVQHILKMHEFVLSAFHDQLSKREIKYLEKSIQMQKNNLLALEQDTIDLRFIKNNITCNPVANKFFALVLLFYAVKRKLSHKSPNE